MSDLVLVNAPFNLGLRPLRPGHVPGTRGAPAALVAAGLVDRLAPARIVDLPAVDYVFDQPEGALSANAPAVRTYLEGLAEVLTPVLEAGDFPLVVGGDCSLLLGCLAAARRLGPVGLVHIDGHSDFRNPANYDAAVSGPGTIAGMDLALATGRGDPLLTLWDGRSDPLVPDHLAVQIGERESRDTDFAWPDLARTGIICLDIFYCLHHGMDEVVRTTIATLDPAVPLWLHCDVDVLDRALMPAVDSPGTPGLDFDQLATLLAELLAGRRCLGLDLTIFDPDLDPDRALAHRLVDLLGRVLKP